MVVPLVGASMRRPGVDAEKLLKVSGRLGDAAVDPMIWPEIMEDISAAAGAIGAGLLQSDSRTPDIPRTVGVDQSFRSYFAHGWHTRDIRAARAVPRLLSGEVVITDQDIVTPREMRTLPFYTEHLPDIGLRWFAVIGFRAGNAHWGLSIQRTPNEGPFDSDAKGKLALLAQRLTETATLSKAVGQAVLSGIANALGLVNQPALALDRMGFVLEANAKAEQIFDDDLRVCNRRIVVQDKQARFALRVLVDQLRTTPDTAALPVDPIVVSRRAKRPLLIRILPVDGAARSPFLGARALLVFSDLEPKSGPQPPVLAQTFGLSRSEAKLAAIVATGRSPREAAAELGIARETARNQLKSIFAKTGTHRQGELIALLSKL
jgi:DNA-binding CsgD family transcriptional regulator